MRKPRILGNRETNYYHIMSRVVNRDYILGAEEKEFFYRTMRRLSAFSGLNILTYCVMSNHWHILIEVPTCSDLSDEVLLKRLKGFYSKARFNGLLNEYERALSLSKETGSNIRLDEFRSRYLSRMGDLSVFVKELKERFSKWYNRKHNRRGTLWEERFKSVLVEDSDHALSTMAAYIDLNPVRGGVVKDPRDYRHCGYGEAVAGRSEARRGITMLYGLDGQEGSWRKIAAAYRTHLFSAGAATETKKGFSREHIRSVLDQGGELKLHELLQCHIRYFNDGVALGSRRFVEEVFEQHRTYFSERRKDGARKMRDGDWQGLFTMRNFSGQPVTAPG